MTMESAQPARAATHPVRQSKYRNTRSKAATTVKPEKGGEGADSFSADGSTIYGSGQHNAAAAAAAAAAEGHHGPVAGTASGRHKGLHGPRGRRSGAHQLGRRSSLLKVNRRANAGKPDLHAH
eukprot:CAMPEP_0119101256 /NCGR_PEP_ID=MMETSP1180-20130426/356_1 /TAXON_ID=3052 ORGANISM="Chlamydomonas cf sp, Strain CCMP681" /NCGR_SAMPLE_ID=MMETSP1180 /ASSEMBLY_ACC=CAM_ASM_000741 /LENGTH=122 /DNA_ID=CAMNT_0007085351 /DNA_START=278 /DNA_END=649 /DNA_ORIENTATION=+